MISNLNSAVVGSTYQNSEMRNRAQEESQNISKQGDASKIESLKASIENGDYKIDLDVLAKKIADELL